MNQQSSSTTPVNERDLWETPNWLYNWLNDRFMFDLDLACNQNNAKSSRGYWHPQTDSLKHAWNLDGLTGFCNPPYSNVKPWLEKAVIEAEKGFTSVFVMPTPNGEKVYGESVFGKASEIIFINGRVAFCRPDGTEVKGNTRGSCIIIYQPEFIGQTSIKWADRNELIEKHKETEV